MKPTLIYFAVSFVLGCILNLFFEFTYGHKFHEVEKVDISNEIFESKSSHKTSSSDVNSIADQPLQNSHSSKPTSKVIAEENQNYEQGNIFLAAQKHKTEKLMALFKNNPKFDLNKAMENTYSAEEYLESWALKRERAIQETFENELIAHGGPLKSISCRSKHCRIEFFYQTDEDINNLSSALSETIFQKRSDLFVSSFDMSHSLENKSVSIYLSDDISASLY
ncbi:MAG TPA: hypothetical protein PK002_08000 [Cellvibrio sp.]|nr:hypothetical protein [Cellvibrio sp.]